MLQLKTLGVTEARLAIDAMRERAAHHGPAVLVVADLHGDIILLERMDGAPASSITIGSNKAFTAAREKVPTSSIGARLRDPNEAFDISYYGNRQYCGWGGGLPIVLDGACVGAVAVSGLAEAVDVQIAEAGLRALMSSHAPE